MPPRTRIVSLAAALSCLARRKLALSLPLVASVLLVGAGQASAATLKVCPSGCSYSEIAPALAVANNGDTIKLAAGTYRGGVTIDVSVKLVGAGAGATVIRGGASVLTIGTIGATSEPTVSIDRVTITGGVARSSPESVAFYGEDGVSAAGGGIEIPPNADFDGGATVTITNSAITANRVAPTHTISSRYVSCPDGPCPFALAEGGGIDNWGTLTLAHTTISDNRVGSASGLSIVASDANAGAINSRGALTIRDSTISGNRASATAPNGRFADSGAIFAESGTLTMTNSTVTNNSATLKASLPDSVDLLAIAGAIHIGGRTSATIRNSTVAENSVSMTNTVGNANAWSGGLHTDVNFKLSNGVIADNSVTATALPGSSGNAAGDSGAGEMGGKITNTRMTGNSVTVSSATADANALAGAAIFTGSMTNSAVSDNHVRGSSPNGTVSVLAGGLMAGEGVTLRNTTVSDNTGHASGLTGSAQGGGIFDAAVPNGPPGGQLTLTNSRVTRNALSGDPSITLQGGGLFLRNPLTLTNSVIANNTPDQCDGC
jgi:hypothetical protein